MEKIGFSGLMSQCWQAVQTDGATLDIADGFRIKGDQSRLQHLFENLFRNAVEHGGTDVIARVGQIDAHGIYVEDTGQGIPEEQRERALEPGH